MTATHRIDSDSVVIIVIFLQVRKSYNYFLIKKKENVAKSEVFSSCGYLPAYSFFSDFDPPRGREKRRQAERENSHAGFRVYLDIAEMMTPSCPRAYIIIWSFIQYRFYLMWQFLTNRHLYVNRGQRANIIFAHSYTSISVLIL
ncbi:hypothetical protein PUN28_008654 [Cardiocondyla obscurior]|uniref:Uncharacterized protein n=1 Tax=Cardiocondyla obscurior TaxID=286306 RepID=A0AAW2G068_9HYME